MTKLALIRSKNVAQKRKSRANMTVSKIEDLRKYDHERKRMMRKRKNEIGEMADPLLNLSVTTSSPKIVSSPKPYVNHKKKSTPKKMIGDLLDSTVEQELSLIKLDGIHVMGNNENFVTERKWVTDSSENYVTEKKIEAIGGEERSIVNKYGEVSFSLQILAQNG